MMLGQGDQYFTENLYGPFPVSKTDQYLSVAYSFFMLGSVEETPRGDVNMFTLAILFLPRSVSFDPRVIQEELRQFTSSLTSVDQLLKNSGVVPFVDKLEVVLGLAENSVTGQPKHRTKNKNSTIQAKPIHLEERQKEKKTAVNLEIPLVLHAVYHGMEHATQNIIPNLSDYLDEQADGHTASLMKKFQFSDQVEGPCKSVEDALELGKRHLKQLGEEVKIKSISESTFEVVITCGFSSSVHPHLPINKCLWVRYIASILHQCLPNNKKIVVEDSVFEDGGSRSLIRILDKIRF